MILKLKNHKAYVNNITNALLNEKLPFPSNKYCNKIGVEKKYLCKLYETKKI